MELAGFRRHHLGLRHYWDGGRQPGWSADVQSAESVEDGFYNAR